MLLDKKAEPVMSLPDRKLERIRKCLDKLKIKNKAHIQVNLDKI